MSVVSASAWPCPRHAVPVPGGSGRCAGWPAGGRLPALPPPRVRSPPGGLPVRPGAPWPRQRRLWGTGRRGRTRAVATMGSDRRCPGLASAHGVVGRMGGRLDSSAPYSEIGTWPDLAAVTVLGISLKEPGAVT